MSASLAAMREFIAIDEDDEDPAANPAADPAHPAAPVDDVDNEVSFDHHTSKANMGLNGTDSELVSPKTEHSPGASLHRAPVDAFLLQSASPLGTKHNIPTSASSASKLKRSLSIATGKNASGNVRVVAELDPENQEIVRLYQEENLSWSEIADSINKKRIAVGKDPSLTANAIYSRYARNAPRIAAVKGEIWDPESLPKVSRKKVKAEEPITGFDDAEDELLVQARHEIEEETWALVSKRIVEKGGKVHRPEMCARRYYLL